MKYRRARQALLGMGVVFVLCGASLTGSVGCVGCKEKAVPGMTYWETDTFNVMIPHMSGWVLDTSLMPVDTAHVGGIIMRLQSNGAVAGSPRIDVVVDPPQPHPTVVEEFLTRNLQIMGGLETQKKIHIDRVEQRHIYVGSHPAYRVHHEYTVLAEGSQIAINQVSTYFVVEGRGIAVVAAGRLELFHPLAGAIQTMLDGIKIEGDTKPPPSDAEPVDLGKVGDKR